MRTRSIELVEKALSIPDVTRYPAFRAGDTIRVVLKVKEGDKIRLQAFEGICIRVRGEGMSKTFSVRKVSFGNVSIVRNFFFYSPLIDNIELLKKGRVRRSRIYYILERKGKAARITAQ